MDIINNKYNIMKTKKSFQCDFISLFQCDFWAQISFLFLESKNSLNFYQKNSLNFLKYETQEDKKDEKEVDEEEEEEEEEEEVVEDLDVLFWRRTFVPRIAVPPADPPEIRDKKLYDDLKRRYNPKTSAAEIILKDYVSNKISHTNNSRYTANLLNDDLFHWEVIVDTHKLNPNTEFYKDSMELKVNEIIFRIIFPPDYPLNAPFVYVRMPRFVQHTGHVTIGGSLCLDLLTENWSPSIKIKTLIDSMLDEMMTEVKPETEDKTKNEILPNIPRINREDRRPYSLEESIWAFKNTIIKYGWPIPTWINEISKEKYQ